MNIGQEKVILWDRIIHDLHRLVVGKILEAKSPSPWYFFQNVRGERFNILNRLLVVLHQGPIYEGDWISLIPSIELKLSGFFIPFKGERGSVHLFINSYEGVEELFYKLLPLLVVDII